MHPLSNKLILCFLQTHRISSKYACYCWRHRDDYFQNHIPKGFLTCHNSIHLLSELFKWFITSYNLRTRCLVGHISLLSGRELRCRAAVTPNSAFTSKHGHALIHSSGSISPFPLRSGLKSRWPHTRLPGKVSSNWCTSKRSAARCSGVRVSAGQPWTSKPPS